MTSSRIHICLEQAGAPAQDAQFDEGARWICSCGSSYVYREGSDRAGHQEMSWWEVPPVIPGPRHARPTLLQRLVRPRRGDSAGS